jgi:hypothetical protein
MSTANVRGPNSASLLTQWQDVAIATAGVMCHEELGQQDKSKLQSACLSKYESLMDYSEMCRVYPQFKEEVLENNWVCPIKANVKDKADTIWTKWSYKPGVLYSARNVWGPEWTKHNRNGIPSGKDKEAHIAEFRQKCYAVAFSEKTKKDLPAEFEAAWKTWYPCWWKVLLPFRQRDEWYYYYYEDCEI